MKNIKQFCEETGFKLEVSEIGIGRPCVGIYNEKEGSYLCYWDYLGRPEKGHNVAVDEQPWSAYHKDAYLVILTEENDISVEKATEQLDEWIGKILKAGYKIGKTQRRTLASMMTGGLESILLDKE